MPDIVLLVDDDATTLNFVESVLTAAGISCLTASEPKQALAIVQARPEITLIVSDICMPTMNGIQFVDRLNSLQLQWRVPSVLFLTGHPTLERAVDALRLGAYDFLRKPVRPHELLEVVKRGLERAERRRVPAAGSSPDIERLIRQAERQGAGAEGAARSVDQPHGPRGMSRYSTPSRGCTNSDSATPTTNWMNWRGTCCWNSFEPNKSRTGCPCPRSRSHSPTRRRPRRYGESAS
jgi:FixJ family two-component response regulator